MNASIFRMMKIWGQLHRWLPWDHMLNVTLVHSWNSFCGRDVQLVKQNKKATVFCLVIQDWTVGGPKEFYPQFHPDPLDFRSLNSLLPMISFLAQWNIPKLMSYALSLSKLKRMPFNSICKTTFPARPLTWTNFEDKVRPQHFYQQRSLNHHMERRSSEVPIHPASQVPLHWLILEGRESWGENDTGMKKNARFGWGWGRRRCLKILFPAEKTALLSRCGSV